MLNSLDFFVSVLSLDMFVKFYFLIIVLGIFFVSFKYTHSSIISRVLVDSKDMM